MEFFRVEVKVWKEQTAGCTGFRCGQWSLLNGGTGFEPTTLTTGKIQGITNVAGDLPLISERKIQESSSIFWQCFWQCFGLVCLCQLRSAGYYIIWSGSLFCCSVFKDRPFIL